MVEPGTYQHWKGPQYLVLGLGHDANDASRTAVVYLPLYPVEGPPFAVRTLEDFLAWVDPATGTTTAKGVGVPRFLRVAAGNGGVSQKEAPHDRAGSPAD